MFINVKTIFDKGHKEYQDFIIWLAENDIPWKDKNSNSDTLWLDEPDDYSYVREIWPEIKKW